MPTNLDRRWSLDTNVLIYATDKDPESADKQLRAQALLARLFRDPQGCIAGQALSEFLSVVLRRRTMPTAMALETVNVWSRAAQVIGASTQAYERAWALAAKSNYHVWDALIISVCAEHGVATLYSEDAGSLKRPLGVRVVNPFVPA